VNRRVALVMAVTLALAACSGPNDTAGPQLTMATSATTSTTLGVQQFPTVTVDPGDATEDELDLISQVASLRSGETKST